MWRLGCAMLAVGFLGGARVGAQVQFTGYFLTDSEARFTLCGDDGTTQSGWLGIGEAFGGYTIKAFDRDHGVLWVDGRGQSLRLGLRPSKVREGARTINGAITLLPAGTPRKFQASFALGIEQSFPLKPGLELHLLAEAMPDGNLRYKPRFVTRTPDGKVTSQDWPFVIAPPGMEFSISTGEVGFSFKP